LCEGVSSLARRVQADRQLTNLIRRKFAIKCTTGYSLNALVDFPAEDPLEIIKHLIIGSEGTLGFVSQVRSEGQERRRKTCGPRGGGMMVWGRGWRGGVCPLVA
jgi:hypothetical protein